MVLVGHLKSELGRGGLPRAIALQGEIHAVTIDSPIRLCDSQMVIGAPLYV